MLFTEADEQQKPTIISHKKQFYPISSPLRQYLQCYDRSPIALPCQYTDLQRHSFSMPLFDKAGKDTLWETVFYTDIDRNEIYPALTTIYAILKAAGNTSVMQHLYVERVDYCTFGNSNPFRIKIVNKYNDNYDYFYIKIADASRVYGLELEHILSPNRINYLVWGNTLVEEHIAGIPGDQFINAYLKKDVPINETRIAKEFIKFNERCLVRLLGDMRAYNFVIDITPDFDDVQYRIRAIDFDQQSYEGRRNVYLPQFFKENYPFVGLCMKRMTPESIRQYQSEERALIGHRILASRDQLNDLTDIMINDQLSLPEKTAQLRRELAEHYQNSVYENAQTMGEILKLSLNL